MTFSTRFNEVVCVEDFGNMGFFNIDLSGYVSLASSAAVADSEFKLLRLGEEADLLMLQEYSDLLDNLDTLVNESGKSYLRFPSEGHVSFDTAFVYGAMRNPLVFSGLIPLNWLLRHRPHTSEKVAEVFELSEWLMLDLTKTRSVPTLVRLARRTDLTVSVARKVLAGCVDENFGPVLEALASNSCVPETLRAEAALRVSSEV